MRDSNKVRKLVEWWKLWLSHQPFTIVHGYTHAKVIAKLHQHGTDHLVLNMFYAHHEHFCLPPYNIWSSPNCKLMFSILVTFLPISMMIHHFWQTLFNINIMSITIAYMISDFQLLHTHIISIWGTRSSWIHDIHIPCSPCLLINFNKRDQGHYGFRTSTFQLLHACTFSRVGGIKTIMVSRSTFPMDHVYP